MTSTFRFFKSELPQAFIADKFFKGEMLDSGFTGTVTVSQTKQLQWSAAGVVTKNTESLVWKAFQVAAQSTNSLSWKTYNPVSKNSESLSWEADSPPIEKNLTLEWEIPQLVDTQANQQMFFQGEYLLNRNDLFFKGRGFFSDFPPNTLAWSINNDLASLILEWAIDPLITQTKAVDWKVGGRITKTLSLSWTSGGKVARDKTLFFTINGALNMAFGLEAYRFIRHRVPNNINYAKYRVLQITNSSGASMIGGATLELEIDHAAMVTAGESDEYGDQLRMTYANGVLAEREIDLQVINPNTSTTKLRFKLQKSLPNSAVITDYRLYSQCIDLNLFEETFRDKKNVYYFFASSLSSNLDLVNGTFTSESTGIKRVTDGNTGSIGFNVPDDAEVEVEFRFLDAGAGFSSRYIGIEWRGDGNSARTFKLDNDNGVTDNQIENYNDGTGWAALGSPVASIKTIPAKMKVRVVGTSVEMYLNDTLVDSATDATPSTGGMRIVFPAGSEALISSLTVSRPVGTHTMEFISTVENVVSVPASHKVLMRTGAVQNVQATVFRLKRQPDDSFILESAKTISEWGDSIPATTNQLDGSLEIKVFNTQNKALANVTELRT